MNSNQLKIGAAMALLAVTLIGRLNGLITDQMLLWAAMIVGMACAAYAFAIGATEYYKRRTFSQAEIAGINDPYSDGFDEQKRRTYKVAVRCGFSGMLICGVIFLLLKGADWRIKVVIGVFWLFGSGIVALTTPLVYRLLRKRFLTVAGENEALDRPTDKPDL